MWLFRNAHLHRKALLDPDENPYKIKSKINAYSLQTAMDTVPFTHENSWEGSTRLKARMIRCAHRLSIQGPGQWKAVLLLVRGVP